ncbi:hypothetical protein K435DRAFT_853475 [Dendrothele bispora CBS 962.96]|uniref:Uncharacterized protein n=1 Tax=Dendrothele bispora (strain CBS 962.96) TaxID=1314807 RepID=A0A4S8MGH6_DENBC|nr:hypothetical protein K435DRAFT_853475 [Dendrothele bispora CBS 962.96]
MVRNNQRLTALKGKSAIQRQRFVNPYESHGTSGPAPKTKLHKPKEIRQLRAQAASEELLCSTDDSDSRHWSSSMDVDVDDDGGWMDDVGTEYSARDVLAGRRPIEVSHEGGEASVLFESLYVGRRRKHIDFRTRQDRTERRTLAFEVHIDAMVSNYMAWSRKLGDEGLGTSTFDEEIPEGSILTKIRVVDLFTSCEILGSIVPHNLDINVEEG